MSPASKMTFSRVTGEESDFITLFMPGRDPLPCGDQHPNFDRVVDLTHEAEKAYRAGDQIEGDRLANEAADLINIEVTVAKAFEVLSERVTVRNGRIFFDGDEYEDSLTKQILRFMDEGEDFGPLVAFMENIAANPIEHTKTRLFDWLNSQDFTITADGMVVGYKSVYSNGDGTYRSTRSGPAIVNGVDHLSGPVVQTDGDTVEMARSQVTHDPSIGCSVGLHVGTREYAEKFDGDTVLECHFNPRDVVSVPTDSYGGLYDNKVRVCRYKVIGKSEAKHETALRREPAPEPDEDRCEDCGYPYPEGCNCVPEPLEPLESAVNDAVQAMRDSLGRWVAGRPNSKRGNNGQFVG